jgi:hypothetical protein
MQESSFCDSVLPLLKPQRQPEARPRFESKGKGFHD